MSVAVIPTKNMNTIAAPTEQPLWLWECRTSKHKLQDIPEYALVWCIRSSLENKVATNADTLLWFE